MAREIFEKETRDDTLRKTGIAIGHEFDRTVASKNAAAV